MSYAQLTRFMLPLVLTALVQELSGQFLNGGMARMPRVSEGNGSAKRKRNGNSRPDDARQGVRHGRTRSVIGVQTIG